MRGGGDAPHIFIGFGAIDVTKPYEFIGFGALLSGRGMAEPCAVPRRRSDLWSCASTWPPFSWRRGHTFKWISPPLKPTKNYPKPPKLGPETPPDRRGSPCSTGCTQNVARRLILRPRCVQHKFGFLLLAKAFVRFYSRTRERWSLVPGAPGSQNSAKSQLNFKQF
jgi:hypothetical protein